MWWSGIIQYFLLNSLKLQKYRFQSYLFIFVDSSIIIYNIIKMPKRTKVFDIKT